jgi:hypothetical protein
MDDWFFFYSIGKAMECTKSILGKYHKGSSKLSSTSNQKGHADIKALV